MKNAGVLPVRRRGLPRPRNDRPCWAVRRNSGFLCHCEERSDAGRKEKPFGVPVRMYSLVRLFIMRMTAAALFCVGAAGTDLAALFPAVKIADYAADDGCNYHDENEIHHSALPPWIIRSHAAHIRLSSDDRSCGSVQSQQPQTPARQPHRPWRGRPGEKQAQ